MAWFIGAMSGTSLDGVDAVLAEGDAGRPLAGRAHVHLGMPAALRDELLDLNRGGGADELHRGALAANALAWLYAQAVERLLAGAAPARRAITAIGAHGQTLRHRPREFDGVGYTIQILNGALLAERCGIAVVCDFRSRDLAAGGVGAPLVPAFHAATFTGAGEDRAVLNLGGIANLTLLGADGSVRGFDCGPGNLLLDLWMRRHQGRDFDADGAWAAAGRVDVALLQSMLAEPYFDLAPPKSTGRDLFDAAWLARHLDPALPARDVMATLAELTATSVVRDLQRHAPAARRLVVCGGGAANGHLMRRLAALLAPRTAVASSAAYGVPPDQVEALAFAWLARAHLEGRAGNLPAVTGAVGPRVLGALYPAATGGA
ncbi:MAG: anhydro-N-acetylmuramic acid kinase [Burkholderiales bacterium]|nr:anhydro-N-acetylmuramic acid kinase [Burkholderiales bacterium]MDE1928680.1 anhydro-N-acetylmuramic acid kinase [Burkholderiales bacterium]MDE2160253.1 anhydro-N-acetylmuramic acid kinase [Burkholderiales bacterium]MDE2501671.1 anhydro-N-acetylmuramic acid kinase [Burkholderiales bacterium]